MRSLWIASWRPSHAMSIVCSWLIAEIVTSYPFLNRHVPTPPTTNAK